MPHPDEDVAPTPPDAAAGVDVTDWQALPPIGGRVRAIGGAMSGLIAGLALGPVFFAHLDSLLTALMMAVGTAAVGSGLGAAIARAHWRRTRWKLDLTGFHVRRGGITRREVLVPRSRVQHLDIERGPLERHFGLATLIVHTAGSHTPALRLGGLADAVAIRLRNDLIPASSHDDDAL